MEDREPPRKTVPPLDLPARNKSSDTRPRTPGALQSPFDASDCLYESIARAPSGHFVATMPARFDLREQDNYRNAARNQGARGTCAAFTGSACGEIHAARAGTPAVLSPEFIYFHRDNRPADGMCGRNVFQIMQRVGTVPESDYPYKRDESAPQPTADLYQTASAYRIASYARITTIDGLKRALLEIGPCYLQLPLYTARPAFWRKSHGESGAGGHAVTVVGYTETGFILRNSWGSKWGPTRDGHIEFPYTDWVYVRECWVPIDMSRMAQAPAKNKQERCSIM